MIGRFSRFQDLWSPKIVGELNDSYIKLAKVHGEFVWHAHADEDEFFLVVKGRLLIRLRDRDVLLTEGEFFVGAPAHRRGGGPYPPARTQSDPPHRRRGQ